jgi:hypothetical protein
LGSVNIGEPVKRALENKCGRHFVDHFRAALTAGIRFKKCAFDGNG